MIFDIINRRKGEMNRTATAGGSSRWRQGRLDKPRGQAGHAAAPEAERAPVTQDGHWSNRRPRRSGDIGLILSLARHYRITPNAPGYIV